MAYGIDRSVLLPVGNDALGMAIGIARDAPTTSLPFRWVDSSKEPSGEAARLRRWVETDGALGVKSQPMDQH